MSEDQGTILIVEDDIRMQKVLDRLFQEQGYRIEVASDGEAGVASFRSCSPVAVVLDLILPKLSGREACKYMKSISPDTPVLILSAVSEVVDKVLLLELGAEDYITKPFSPREPSGAGAGLYSTSAQIGDDRDVYIRRLRGGFPQNDREERRQVDHAHRGRV